jgi:hypothetical protein
VEHSGAADKSLVVVGPRLNHPGLLLSPRADAECWPLVADWIARRSLPVPVPAGIAT